MKNNKNKRIRNSLISVLLILSLIITGIFAFLWSSDSKVNKFTVGNVDIVLHEDKWYDDKGNVKNDSNTNGVPDFAENLLPGDIVDKAPYVENTGENNAHIFLAVGIPVKNINEVFTEDGSYSGVNIEDIVVNAYGIQENYAEKTSSEDIWNAYVAENGINKMFGEKVSLIDAKIELFKLIGLNTEDWTAMNVYSNYSDLNNSSVSYMYPSEDGHNYYFFKYNNDNKNAVLNKGNLTGPLFIFSGKTTGLTGGYTAY